MTKKEFVADLVEKSGVEMTQKDMEEVFNKTFELIKERVNADKKFTVSGFGTFRLKERKARTARNPRTGESVKVGASKTIAFKASTTMKDQLK